MLNWKYPLFKSNSCLSFTWKLREQPPSKPEPVYADGTQAFPAPQPSLSRWPQLGEAPPAAQEEEAPLGVSRGLHEGASPHLTWRRYVLRAPPGVLIGRRSGKPLSAFCRRNLVLDEGPDDCLCFREVASRHSLVSEHFCWLFILLSSVCLLCNVLVSSPPPPSPPSNLVIGLLRHRAYIPKL